ncbi:hypothetical protein [Streptomyces flavofungini]|uniref:hypothetical protein n=1 Tax=Streptomyces flavofungini TaxID=68200 RepID=UPI0034DDEC61
MADVQELARAAGVEPTVMDWLTALDGIARGLPELGSPDPARRRRAAHELSDTAARRFTLTGDARCELSEHRVPTRSGEITVLHYRPPGDRPRLGHLSLHGGGFTLGSVHEVVNDRLLRHRAAASSGSLPTGSASAGSLRAGTSPGSSRRTPATAAWPWTTRCSKCLG